MKIIKFPEIKITRSQKKNDPKLADHKKKQDQDHAITKSAEIRIIRSCRNYSWINFFSHPRSQDQIIFRISDHRIIFFFVSKITRSYFFLISDHKIILRIMGSFYSWFWNNGIMSLFHIKIVGSQKNWILRSGDHCFSSFWDHGIMSCLHFEITGSQVFFIWGSQDHGFFWSGSQKLSGSRSCDHKNHQDQNHKITKYFWSKIAWSKDHGSYIWSPILWSDLWSYNCDKFSIS